MKTMFFSVTVTCFLVLIERGCLIGASNGQNWSRFVVVRDKIPVSGATTLLTASSKSAVSCGNLCDLVEQLTCNGFLFQPQNCNSNSLNCQLLDFTTLDTVTLESSNNICIRFYTRSPLYDPNNNLFNGGQPQASMYKTSPVFTTASPYLSLDSSVSAIVLFNDELYVTREANQVVIYSTPNLQLRSYINLPNAGSPLYGLAICPLNNYLYVSDYYNNLIHQVNLTSKSEINSWPVANYPRGLSLNSQHNLLVACQSMVIQEYTQDGTLVRTITDNNCLAHAVELSSGILAVSRTGPVNGVCMMTVNGEVLHSFGPGNYGSLTVNPPNDVGYVVVDPEGFILLSDSPYNRVTVLNQTLTGARLLPIPSNVTFIWSFAMALDAARGLLYVGNTDSGEVEVVPNVFNLGELFERNDDVDG